MQLTSRHRVAALVVAVGFVSSCTSSGPSGGLGSLVPPPASTGLSEASALTVIAPASCDLVGCVGEGIDTSSGAFTAQVEDLRFPPGLFGVELIRHYRSDRLETGWFGRGWSTIFETTLVKDTGGWVLDASAGLTPLWSPEAPSLWRITGSPQVESLAGGGGEFMWPSGEVWSFGADGALRNLTSPYGQKVDISRDGSGSVSIRSSQGVSVELSVVGGLVTQVRADDGGEPREVTFTYSGDLLEGVEAPGLSLRGVRERGSGVATGR